MRVMNALIFRLTNPKFSIENWQIETSESSFLHLITEVQAWKWFIEVFRVVEFPNNKKNR